MDLRTCIGDVVLTTPILNASGPRCTNMNELINILFSDSSAIVSKSCTIDKREGNEKPRYYDNEKLSINSMGLPNKGYFFYTDMIDVLTSNNSVKPYIISVAGLSCSDNIIILKAILDKIMSLDDVKVGVEINLSCPNIVGKGQLAYDFDAMDKYLNKLFQNIDIEPLKLIGIKLPPYFELHQFKIVSDIILKYPIDFITTINSIGNGLVIDVEKECPVIAPKQGLGGIGGSVVKPTALSNVFNFAKLFYNTPVKVIGCGGVESGSDVFEFLLAGASAVQIGTQFHKEDVSCFSRITRELEFLMERKNYKHLGEFKRKLLFNDVFVPENEFE